MGTVRTMISLPEELKKRMDKMDGNVNWSAVARQAIEETLARVEKPAWNEVKLQEYRNGCAGDLVPLNQYIEDASASLGILATWCKDARHDDPGFRDWYQSIRDAASRTIVALEHLQEVAAKHQQ